MQLEQPEAAAALWTRLKKAGLSPPVIVKPLAACGVPQSHKMALLTSENVSAEVAYPAIAQQFINHGGVLHKVSVLGWEVGCLLLPILQP